MRGLTIGEYVKNRDARQSLGFKMDSEGGKYYMNGKWVTLQEVDKAFPLIPLVRRRWKGENADVQKRYLTGEKSY